jgi:hypothetical protein
MASFATAASTIDAAATATPAAVATAAAADTVVAAAADAAGAGTRARAGIGAAWHDVDTAATIIAAKASSANSNADATSYIPTAAVRTTTDAPQHVRTVGVFASRAGASAHSVAPSAKRRRYITWCEHAYARQLRIHR